MGYGLIVSKNIFMMDSQLNLEAPWAEVKELLQEVNPSLSDEDLEYKYGQEDELLDRLAIKMKRDRQYIKKWIESVSYNRGIAS